MKAKSLSKNVVVSGLCPRLDDRLDNIPKANDILRKIANDEGLYYIDNKSVLRLYNNSVNTSLYELDGIHLSIHGTYTVANNPDINSQERQITSAKRQELISQGMNQIKSQNIKSFKGRHVQNIRLASENTFIKENKTKQITVTDHTFSNRWVDRNRSYRKTYRRNDFHMYRGHEESFEKLGNCQRTDFRDVTSCKRIKHKRGKSMIENGQGGMDKRNDKVTYPETLNIDQFCSQAMELISKPYNGLNFWYENINKSWKDPDKSIKEVEYKLEELKKNPSTIQSKSSRGYVNKQEEQKNDTSTWYYISDTFVKVCKKKDAINNKNAYILLYEKM
ncbi:unnamed protein product [Mytilus edulis]|uniref:Uncharacterized protein n=1 Tax=Mytilus edulis TaxID=6550 RepID=A0A8S3QAH1_MYTED|nr:unnamed protein product [Mytilus edulis]